MAGDLEDFLRRAAQRRQQKAQQQKQQPAAPARREPPQYSDRHRERIARPVDLEDPVLTAEIVEDDGASAAATLRRAEAANHAAMLARQKSKREEGRGITAKPKSRTVTSALTGSPASDLVNMLRQPGGIQQAILLREILDRPEHRW